MNFNFQNCKEWRSKKELENVLIEKNRDEIIGWVSWKTMKKWGEEIYRHQENDEDMFIYQKGKKLFLFNF